MIKGQRTVSTQSNQTLVTLDTVILGNVRSKRFEKISPKIL